MNVSVTVFVLGTIMSDQKMVWHWKYSSAWVTHIVTGTLIFMSVQILFVNTLKLQKIVNQRNIFCQIIKENEIWIKCNFEIMWHSTAKYWRHAKRNLDDSYLSTVNNLHVSALQMFDGRSIIYEYNWCQAILLTFVLPLV